MSTAGSRRNTVLQIPAIACPGDEICSPPLMQRAAGPLPRRGARVQSSSHVEAPEILLNLKGAIDERVAKFAHSAGVLRSFGRRHRRRDEHTSRRCGLVYA